MDHDTQMALIALLQTVIPPILTFLGGLFLPKPGSGK